jgi:pimeloyl-ACP methyl ester carboxylesterase
VDHNAWFDLTPVKDVAERYAYVVAAPNGRGDRYYSGEGEQDVLDVIDDVQRRCRVDPDRVYLTGHSMGGWGTWYLGLRHPGRFAAICPMAGVAPSLDRMPNARHLAPFIIHDTGDDVVPVTQSRLPAARLAELGISFQYREESGFGHRSALIGANLPRVLDWFNTHPRVQRPGRITLVAGAGDPTEAYWLTAFQVAPGATLGSVDARLDEQGRLVVEVENVRRLELNLEAMPTDAESPLEVLVNGRRVTRVDRRGCLALRSPDGVAWQRAGDATAD